jgi:hypothetical protein
VLVDRKKIFRQQEGIMDLLTALKADENLAEGLGEVYWGEYNGKEMTAAERLSYATDETDARLVVGTAYKIAAASGDYAIADLIVDSFKSVKEGV